MCPNYGCTGGPSILDGVAPFLWGGHSLGWVGCIGMVYVVPLVSLHPLPCPSTGPGATPSLALGPGSAPSLHCIGGTKGAASLTTPLVQ